MTGFTWTPIWALPNVKIDKTIEASHAALVPSDDERVRSIARQRPAFETFLTAFRDEFGNTLALTIGMVREGAPSRVKTVPALGGFRDAICFSAIVASQCLAMKSQTLSGVVYSDAFDVYPWFPTKLDEDIYAFTPAMLGMHEVGELRPQSAPALGKRSVPDSCIDQPLLGEILTRWENCFVTGDVTAEHLRLFRSLEMARAASRMPGGTDATFYDEGRAAMLWVSAFEILVHNGVRANIERVLLRLNSVPWLSPKLKAKDQLVKVGKGNTVQTNLAGAVYEHLNRARNDFIHGNLVTPETLKLKKSGMRVNWFAAPLFRLALTASLDLHFSEELPETADEQDLGRHIASRIAFNSAQKLSEEAILVAAQVPEAPARRRRG